MNDDVAFVSVADAVGTNRTVDHRADHSVSDSASTSASLDSGQKPAINQPLKSITLSVGHRKKENKYYFKKYCLVYFSVKQPEKYAPRK